MQFSARLTLILSLLCGAASCALGQAAQTLATGTITGRVMIGDKPAHGIVVTLTPVNEYRPYVRKSTARATTDAEGQFRLSNVAAGRYEVMPVAPVFVVDEGANGYRSRGKIVNLSEGETIEKIDFTLLRGGVITGRVTDADGRPVIAENVTLALADQNNNRGGQFFYNPFMFQTDDRGVYRIYGIAPGRYLVSVGQDNKSGMVRMSIGRGGFYARTFHPGVTDETKATVLEIKEGSEATNVDITLGHQMATYLVSGTVVDAETGKPVANIGTIYGAILEGENQIHSFGMGARTDAEGRFRFEGVMPGHYAAFAAPDTPDAPVDSYSAPAMFEVNEGDVSGLVIKVQRGGGISGVAVIEGTTDRAVLAKLSQLRLQYWSEESEGIAAPVFGEGTRISADGSFHIRALRPGKFRLNLGGWPPPKGFSLLRVERDGVEQRAGILEVGAGEQVSGVRLILEYGSGIVRGQVRVENGTLPEGTHLYVRARRPTVPEQSLPGAEVDARGRFSIEGLPPGQYQLRLAGRLGQNSPPFKPVIQTVNVTNGVETEVTFVVDPNAKVEPEKP